MLRDIAILNIAVSALLVIWSILDRQRRPPSMTAMKWVWPFTFLWGGVFTRILYLWFGRAPREPQDHGMLPNQRVADPRRREGVDVGRESTPNDRQHCDRLQFH